MTEYKGFKFMQYANGQWILRLPNGFRSIVQAKDEDEIRARIDDLVENFQMAS